jgi:2-polyprenyl-3-methyl-5-hydroxy-6-metoxy-1,4-benzoquinol methylase
LAAAASAGISNDAIHEAMVQVVARLDVAGDLLDFGAGTGTLAGRFHQMGRYHSVTAIDLMPRPTGITDGIRWVSADLNAQTNFSDEAFDVLVAAEVIEHLENPRALAREWYRLLRAGGWVVLSTPNNESWRSLGSLLLAGHFTAFRDGSYPAHITPLLRKDIERVLREAGFAAPRFAFTNVGGFPKMPWMTWQAISVGRFKGLRYSDNLLAMALKP